MMSSADTTPRTLVRLCIAGTRTWDMESNGKTFARIMKRVLAERGWRPDMVISGCAQGVDSIGQQWAEHYHVYVVEIPARWDQYGDSAGPRRNEMMARLCDAAVVFPHPDGRGSQDLLRRLRSHNKPHTIVDASTLEITHVQAR